MQECVSLLQALDSAGYVGVARGKVKFKLQPPKPSHETPVVPASPVARALGAAVVPQPLGEVDVRMDQDQDRKVTAKVRPWLQAPGVLGYCVHRPDGSLADHAGEVREDVAERVAYFRLVAMRTSDALGLERPLGMQFFGKSKRLVSVVRADGHVVHVLLAPNADLAAVSKMAGGA
jgi:hypothetical protein